jgi:TPR repeat protein
VDKDIAAFADLLRKSAQHGLAVAQYNLSQMLSTGNGTEKNEVEAAAWMKKAAEQGIPTAEYDYALDCMNGIGRPPDATEALHWFHAAALQGLPDAENGYGYAITTASGPAQDLVAAYEWYLLAISQRDSEDVAKVAQVNMDAITPHMTEDQIKEARERASRFVPMPEYHQKNDILAISEEMEQKAAPPMGVFPP